MEPVQEEEIECKIIQREVPSKNGCSKCPSNENHCKEDLQDDIEAPCQLKTSYKSRLTKGVRKS